MTEKQLFIDVVSIQTSSGQETMMINYIQDFCKNKCMLEKYLVIKKIMYM